MRTALLALAALLLPASAHAQKSETGITYVKADDPAMTVAIAKARRTLPDFFTHLAAPAEGEYAFMIKYDLIPGDGAEYIWADVISHTPGITIARLANVPLDTRFKLGEKVSVADAEIIDWGYFSGGVMQGNYTTRALLDRYDPADAAALRKAFNW